LGHGVTPGCRLAQAGSPCRLQRIFPSLQRLWFYIYIYIHIYGIRRSGSSSLCGPGGSVGFTARKGNMRCNRLVIKPTGPPPCSAYSLSSLPVAAPISCSISAGRPFRAGTSLPEQRPSLAPVKTSRIQTKTQEPELRAARKHDKVQQNTEISVGTDRKRIREISGFTHPVAMSPTAKLRLPGQVIEFERRKSLANPDI
jgi:hypothetical protein